MQRGGQGDIPTSLCSFCLSPSFWSCLGLNTPASSWLFCEGCRGPVGSQKNILLSRRPTWAWSEVPRTSSMVLPWCGGNFLKALCLSTSACSTLHLHLGHGWHWLWIQSCGNGISLFLSESFCAQVYSSAIAQPWFIEAPIHVPAAEPVAKASCNSPALARRTFKSKPRQSMRM